MRVRFTPYGLAMCLALAVLTLAGMLAPPAQAQAPATKVTITGFINTYTVAVHNLTEAWFHRPAGDSMWVTNTRGRLFVTGEVGKAKGVLGLEIDENWGQVGYTDSATLNTNTTQRSSTNGAFDLGVDTAGIIEIKHLYVTFPVPLVPIPTTLTLGAHGVNVLYKPKILLTDDIGGVTLVSTFAPNVKWHFSYAQIEENLVGNRPLASALAVTSIGCTSTTTNAQQATPGTGCARGDDFALATSLEYTPIKGLDLRPIYAYLYAIGATPTAARQIPGGIGGTLAFARTTAMATPQHKENRHTFGVDASWKSGPWSVAPTFLYQLGTRDTDNPFVGVGQTNAIREADLNAWIFDLEGSYKIGPLLLSARYVYTPGNRPMDQLSKDVNYYQPISVGGDYWTGFGELFGPGTTTMIGDSNNTHKLADNISFERYGRQQFAVRAIYSATPALDLHLSVSPLWTARSVDTDGTKTTAGVFTCATHSANSTANPQGAGCRGDESYVGTDTSFKIVWKFAPGLEFQWGAAYLFAGDALDISEVRNGILTKNSGKDGYQTAAMVGFSF